MSQVGWECSEARAGSVPTVLIVDDEPSARLLLRTLLEQLDIPVRIAEAADGDAAMDRVREARPDLVLLDIILPDSRASGVMLCKVLAKDPRTKVVIVSGSANDTIAQTCLCAGAIDIIRKPFSVELMQRRIAEWLEPATTMSLEKVAR